MFISSNILGFTQTCLIEGNVFLENQTNHSGVAITFNRIAPTSLTYTFYSNESGAFSNVIEDGIYNVIYEKDGYISVSTNDNYFYSNTQLNDVILLSNGLYGNLSGILPKGTYKISSDLIVPAGTTLTIEPGTNLHFMQNARLLVKGSLNAIGTISDSIKFSRYNEMSWGGLKFTGSNSELSYCIVEYSNDGGVFTEQIPNSFTINHSVIRNNSNDDGDGGGIYLYDHSNIYLYNNKIYNNHARSGGGLYIDQSANCVVSSCLIYNNSVENAGSGIVTNKFAGSITFINCIITNNFGGGDFTGGIHEYHISCDYKNNIITNNEGYGIYLAEGSNAYVAYNNVYGNSVASYYNTPPNVGIIITNNSNGVPCDAYHNIQINPLFVNESAFDYHLSDNSPCIDAGFNSFSFYNFDFDNNVRIWDGNNDQNAIIDIGAFEYGAQTYNNIESNKRSEIDIFVHPNPTSRFLNIKFSDENIKILTISDITGRQLIEKTVTQTTEQIDLSRFKNGLYIIRIKIGKEIFTTKIVKE